MYVLFVLIWFQESHPFRWTFRAILSWWLDTLLKKGPVLLFLFCLGRLSSSAGSKDVRLCLFGGR